MEIIKRGELPGEKVYETSCSHCKTRFRFKRDEARPSRDQRDGTLLIVKCPLPGCGKECYANG